MRTTLLLALASLTACDASAPALDGGPIDAGPVDCNLDVACPSGAPVWGGPCEGALTCVFATQCGPGTDDLYECVAGQWTLTMPGFCAGGGPPLAEDCSAPLLTALPGASAWISADRAGAPAIADGELVEVAYGAQGLAMLPLRVHVDAETPPPCVRITTTLGLEGVPGAPATHDVRLRCGSSLRIQDVLPELPCEEREYAVTIDLDVEGVGTITRDVRIMGGGCTG